MVDNVKTHPPFWVNFTTGFSQLILDYISAKKDDNTEMKLETFAEMLPLDFMCGHQHYS